MTSEHLCSKIDYCSKIRMLQDHEWSCDSQFIDSVKKICIKCKEETK